MTDHDKLMLFANMVQADYPAMSLQLRVIARDVKRMEEALDAIVEESRVVAFRPVRDVIEPIVQKAVK